MDAKQVMGADAGNIVLAVSLELSSAQWKVALHDGLRERPAVHAVGTPQAGVRLQSVLELIEQHKLKWALSSRGIECYMVDAASIPVERHKRRAKTDRLDALTCS